MNPWRSLLRSLKAELDRSSQEVAGRHVLPNAIRVALPRAQHERWSHVLEPVTAELGEALARWADDGGRHWYADDGPRLTVCLERRERVEIVCEFRKDEDEVGFPERC